MVTTTHPDPMSIVKKHLEYLRLRGRAATTIYARERALARLAGLLGCPLLAATPADLWAWRAGLDLAPHTTCSYISHISQFYGWTVATGMLERNPAAGLPSPWPGRRLPRPIAERDLMMALAAAPARIRQWLVLAGWGGLRAIEIALLRRECVLDWAPSPVILLAADATKGGAEHIVPMSAFVRAELVPVLPARGWVFPRYDGAPGPNTPGWVSKLCNRHLHECGLTATLHMLRHRFGSMTYQHDHDLRAVQEMLGHRRPESTAGYAAYHQPGAAAAVEALPVPAP